MGEDKKGLLTIILGKKPAGEPKQAEKTEDAEDSDEGAVVAAEELLKAIKDDDAEAVVAAFKALRDCCEE
jgi:hypothetical protein